jgi:exonuclease SbcC
MIPLSLTIKGIYSYQDKEQTIDFVKLSSSGLFGIFGSVGSGKSTILEAISFALYGETERLNSRDNRSYNMMNLKSDNFLIDFIFLNAPDELKYRFVAKTNRKKKKFEDVNTIERLAYKLIENEWVPIPAKSAEDICGLSYTNFRRTVIIPQGKFQEFLQLGDTERSKMMKELFHLERFDLWGKAKTLEEKNDALIQNISGQLEQLVEVTEEKGIEIKRDIETTKKNLDSVQKQSLELNSEIEGLKQLKGIFDRIEAEQKVLESLQNQKPLIENLKKGLHEYIQCTAKFSGIIDKLNDLKSRKNILSGELKKIKDLYQDIDNQLIKLEPIFVEIKKKYDSKEELKKLADDCCKLMEIRSIESEVNHQKLRHEKGEKEKKKCEIKIEEYEKNKNALKENLAKLKQDLPDLAKLALIKSWFTKFNVLQNEQSLLKNEDEILKNQIDVCQNKLKAIAKNLNFEYSPETLKQNISQKLSLLEKEIEGVENELKHLKIRQGLISYSQQLIEGKPCPVCGSVHHPEKMEASDLSAKLKESEDKVKKLTLERKKLVETEKESDKCFTELKLLDKRATELKLKIGTCYQNLEKHKQDRKFDEEMDEVSVEKAFSSAEIIKTDISQTENKLEKTEKLVETEKNNKDRYQAELHNIEISINSKSTNLEVLKNQLSIEFIDEFSDKSNSAIESEIKQMETSYNKLINDYHAIEKQISELKPQKDKLHGNIESKEKGLSELVVEIQEYEVKLEFELRNSTYKSIDDVSTILSKSYDINAENKKINEFENKHFSVNEQLQKLKHQTEGQIFDNNAYNQKLNNYSELLQKLNDGNKQLGSLEKELAKLTQKLADKTSLKQQFDSLTERGENIKTLKSLLKGSGFVNFISSVYLQNLVNAANFRFQKLTNQKLRLELTDTNDFIIRDYLNEGKTRSVKTLSGGQTFQASLSLALALADSVQSINKAKDNFFFLDEGFGSLDKDSLATVFDSLKSLRYENRIVGVISHVEELQQEIDNYLRIENTLEEGSIIEASWEF